MGSVGANRSTTSTANTTANLGYNDQRLANLEQIRENSETRRVVEEARRENEAGSRNWEPTQGQRLSNVSSQRAENELFNAPVGTVITMDNHNTGDYVGEYTRTERGWEGSQRYRSNRQRPATVTTARGFAMQVAGNDIRVVTVGRRRR